jgi:hypothetical protein
MEGVAQMRQSTGKARWPMVALVIGVAVLASGCGSSDAGDGDAARPKPKYSWANEAPENFARRVARLLATTRTKRDCAQLAETMSTSGVSFPCPPDQGLRQSMAEFKVIDAAAYGTGAIVDFKSGSSMDGAAIIMTVAPGRAWGISQFGVATKPSVGTSDADSRDSYEAALSSYLSALRKRDCPEFKEVSFTASNSKASTCAMLFDEVAPIANALKRNPHAQPVYRGGNATFGFYSLETKTPRPANRTFGIVNGSAIGVPRSMVISAAVSPTTAEHRTVIQEFKQQQREERRASRTTTDQKPE